MTPEHNQAPITNNTEAQTPPQSRSFPRLKLVSGGQPITTDTQVSHSSTTNDELPAQQPVGNPPAPNAKPVRAAAKTAARTKQTPSGDLTPTRTNRCPAAGTDEAKKRTLKASYARCKDDAARAKFLGKHNLRAEDLQSSKEKTPTPSPRKRKSETREVSAELSGGQQQQGFSENRPTGVVQDLVQRIQSVAAQDVETEQRRAVFISRISVPIVEDEINARFEYYLGRGRPHTFVLVVRGHNVGNTTEDVTYGDYIDLTMMTANLNGLQSLQTTHEILTTIRHNADAVRCEIQHLANPESRQESRSLSPFLPSAMLSSVAPNYRDHAEICPQGHRISPATVLNGCTVVIDITDVQEPRYGYLLALEDGVHIVAHYPTHLGEDYFNAQIFPSHPEIYDWTSRLAQWQLVRPSAIHSAWGFPIAQVQPRDVFRLGENEAEFWEPILRP